MSKRKFQEIEQTLSFDNMLDSLNQIELNIHDKEFYNLIYQINYNLNVEDIILRIDWLKQIILDDINNNNNNNNKKLKKNPKKNKNIIFSNLSIN